MWRSLAAFAILCACAHTVAGALADPRAPPGPEFKLSQVQVVIRHGDRTPINRLPDDQAYYSRFWESVLAPKIVSQAHAQFRATYGPSLAGVEGWAGQLTPAGCTQLQSLGAWLRGIYVNQLNLLPTTDIFDSNKTRVISSMKPRTVESAQHLMYGLDTIRSFPLDTSTKRFELIPLDITPEADAESKRYRALEPYLSQVQKESDRLFALATTAMGIPHNAENVTFSKVCDSLYVRSHYGFTVPLSPQDFFGMQKHKHFGHLELLRHREFTLKAATPLFTLMTDEMQKAVQKTADARKFVLLSGHDITISILLGGVLKAQHDRNPPYASTLEFLLWERVGGGEGAVTVVYNGQRITEPICGSTNGVCGANAFFDLLK